MALLPKHALPLTSNSLGALAAVIAATGYGSAYVVARISYDLGLNALTLNTLRFAVLALICLVWARLSRVSLALPARSLRPAAIVGLLIAVSGGCNLSSIAFIPVSLAILVFYTYPLVTLALNGILERRPPGASEYAAFGCAFIGLALTLQVSFEQLNATGVGLALIGSLGAATHLVVAQRVLQVMDFRVVALLMGLVAGGVTGLVTVAADAVALPEPGPGLWLLAYVIAGFCVGIGAMLVAVQLVGSVRTSMILCLEPPVVIGFAYLLLGERMTAIQLVGALLVVAGISIAQGSRRRPRERIL